MIIILTKKIPTMLTARIRILSLAFILLSSFISYSQNNESSPTEQDTIETVDYCSYIYSNEAMRVVTSRGKTSYDSIIYDAYKFIGEFSPNILIKRWLAFNAAIRMESSSSLYIFLYNAAFFDSLYAKTKNLKSIYSVCFHEIKHDLSRHPDPSNTKSGILKEFDADRYSGFQMFKMGATLDESTLAIRYFGHELSKGNHADKKTRITAIEKGYNEASIQRFKKTSDLNKTFELNTVDLINALCGVSDTMRHFAKFYVPVNEKVSERDFIKFRSNKKLFSDKIINISNKKTEKTSKIFSFIPKQLNKKLYLINGQIIHIDDAGIKFFGENESIGNVEIVMGGDTKLNFEGLIYYLDKKGNVYTFYGEDKVFVGNQLK